MSVLTIPNLPAQPVRACWSGQTTTRLREPRGPRARREHYEIGRGSNPYAAHVMALTRAAGRSLAAASTSPRGAPSPARRLTPSSNFRPSRRCPVRARTPRGPRDAPVLPEQHLAVAEPRGGCGVAHKGPATGAAAITTSQHLVGDMGPVGDHLDRHPWVREPAPARPGSSCRDRAHRIEDMGDGDRTLRRIRARLSARRRCGRRRRGFRAGHTRHELQGTG